MSYAGHRRLHPHHFRRGFSGRVDAADVVSVRVRDCRGRIGRLQEAAEGAVVEAALFFGPDIRVVRDSRRAGEGMTRGVMDGNYTV